jgi:hypothetical protein
VLRDDVDSVTTCFFEHFPATAGVAGFDYRADKFAGAGLVKP